MLSTPWKPWTKFVYFSPQNNTCIISLPNTWKAVKPGFHLQQTPRPRHKKQSDYVVEHSSFPLTANCFVLTQNWSFSLSKLALSLVSITRQTPRPQHKNKAIIRLSSHPSLWSLCFDSKLVVVVVVIGLMETRPYGNQALGFSTLSTFAWFCLKDVRLWMSIFSHYHYYYVLTSLAILSLR